MFNSNKQTTWNEVLHQHLEAKFDESELTITKLADLMFMSERQLYRRMKEEFGVTPKEYVNHFRFKKAYNFLTQGTYKTVRETANAVGFKDIVYFARQFKNRFGMLPSEVAENY